MAQLQLEALAERQILLVVDDREENLVAMEALLGDGQWDVRTVDSGEAALRCMMEEDVGLVLLDVQMPKMDGFEVARLMRGSPHTRYTPIIFLSAIAHTEDSVLQGYAIGAVDFILKPFDPKVLKHKIGSLLEQERHRHELLQLTQQLDRERAFNASVLANASEGILVIDKDGVIRFANPAMAQMLQGEVADLQGSALLAYLKSPQMPSEWKDSEFYRHWRSGQTYRIHDAVLGTLSGGFLPELHGVDRPGHVGGAQPACPARISGGYRRADRPVQPPWLSPGAGERPVACRPQWQAHGCALSGSGRFQTHQ
jgi:CheY-like chemotaxis protein